MARTGHSWHPVLICSEKGCKFILYPIGGINLQTCFLVFFNVLIIRYKNELTDTCAQRDRHLCSSRQTQVFETTDASVCPAL